MESQFGSKPGRRIGNGTNLGGGRALIEKGEKKRPRCYWVGKECPKEESSVLLREEKLPFPRPPRRVLGVTRKGDCKSPGQMGGNTGSGVGGVEKKKKKQSSSGGQGLERVEESTPDGAKKTKMPKEIKGKRISAKWL